MTRGSGDDKKPKNPKQSNGRSARLAVALRENLRRRKSQLRQRGGGTSPEKPVAAPEDSADR
jgi:hypothetical protein